MPIYGVAIGEGDGSSPAIGGMLASKRQYVRFMALGRGAAPNGQVSA